MTNRIIHTSDDLPRDHWIARQLPAGTSLRPYAEDEAMTVLTSAAEDAIDEAGLTRAQVAELLGNTRSYVSQVLSGRTNMTLKTLGALFWAAGRQIAEIRTEPIGTMPSAHQPEATTSVFNGTTDVIERVTRRAIELRSSAAASEASKAKDSPQPSLTPDAGRETREPAGASSVPLDVVMLLAAEALEDAASDCEAQARADYGDPPHPAMQRKYDREIAIASERRALAAQLRGGTESGVQLPAAPSTTTPRAPTEEA